MLLAFLIAAILLTLTLHFFGAPRNVVLGALVAAWVLFVLWAFLAVRVEVDSRSRAARVDSLTREARQVVRAVAEQVRDEARG